MNRNFFFVIAVFLLAGCVHNAKLQYSYQQISVRASGDTSIQHLVRPYKAGLDSLMNEVIGVADGTFQKGLPESSLGNLVCDELLSFVKKDTSLKIDFCMFNNGGLRVNSISAGPVRKGQLYELLPFENTLELIEMDGASCRELLDRAAAQGGVPVSGIRFHIKEQKAEDILINGIPFDEQKNYFILTNDYLANGGEAVMRKAVRKISLGIKLREGLIEQFRFKKENNQPLKPITDGRISKI